jgi:antitoxin YefM
MTTANFEAFCHYCFPLIKYLYLYIINIKTDDMIAANFSEFRTNLKKYLDHVEDNNETLIVKRKTGKGTVMISLDEYNSIMETVHVLSSKANADNLYESIRQMKQGEKTTKRLIEE